MSGSKAPFLIPVRAAGWTPPWFVAGDRSANIAVVAADYAETIQAINTRTGDVLASIPYDHATGGFYYMYGAARLDASTAVFLGNRNAVGDNRIMRALDRDLATVWEWTATRTWSHNLIQLATDSSGTVYFAYVSTAGVLTVEAVRAGSTVWVSGAIAVSGVTTTAVRPKLAHDGTRLWVAVRNHVVALDPTDGSVLDQSTWAAGALLSDGACVAAGASGAWAGVRDTSDDTLYVRSLSYSGGIVMGTPEAVYAYAADGGSMLLTAMLADGASVYFGMYDPTLTTDQVRVIKYATGTSSVAWSTARVAASGSHPSSWNLGLAEEGPVLAVGTDDAVLPLALVFDAASGSYARGLGTSAASGDNGWVAVLDVEAPA